jgi:hypothetical protein
VHNEAYIQRQTQRDKQTLDRERDQEKEIKRKRSRERETEIERRRDRERESSCKKTKIWLKALHTYLLVTIQDGRQLLNLPGCGGYGLPVFC